MSRLFVLAGVFLAISSVNSSLAWSAATAFPPDSSDIAEPRWFYQQGDYAPHDVIRMDLYINTLGGVCEPNDLSGCTFDDVLADIDGKDELTVDIPVFVSLDGEPPSDAATNATLRQRGESSRKAPQKSFRIKLDSKEKLWRNERRLQLNKHPYDPSRIRNKLAFDLMQDVPHLPSLRTQFVNLWIDSGSGLKDFGLFTHVEHVGKEYIGNRALGEGDNLYKVELFRFSANDIENLQVDEHGTPMNDAMFESSVEIKRGQSRG